MVITKPRSSRPSLHENYRDELAYDDDILFSDDFDIEDKKTPPSRVSEKTTLELLRSIDEKLAKLLGMLSSQNYPSTDSEAAGIPVTENLAKKPKAGGMLADIQQTLAAQGFGSEEVPQSVEVSSAGTLPAGMYDDDI